MKKILRPLGLVTAFIVGFAFPQLHVLSGIIPWFVRMMIFMVFLQCQFNRIRLRRSHFLLLAANLSIGLLLCELFRSFGWETLAETAYFLGTAPTATSAPAVMAFLGGNVEYVITSFLLSTSLVALSLPLFLPWAVNDVTPGVLQHVALNAFSVFVLPMILAVIVRYFFPSARTGAKKFQDVVFYAWVLMIAIICSNASNFLQTEPNLSRTILLEIGLLSLIMCAVHFLLGYCFGEKGFRHEASQSLGQKNTSVTIYLALTYANPLVALGPTLYVLWHNLWNAWQLKNAASEKQKFEPEPLPFKEDK